MPETKTKPLADRLPYGAGREIKRRLDESGDVTRSIGHISRVLSGEREDAAVDVVARQLLREKWKRSAVSTRK